MGAAAMGDGGALADIVVVTFNARRHLPRLKTHLEAQTEQRFRLIVLDNASDPDQRPQAKDLPAGALLVHSETNLGFAAGNNQAATLGQAPFLALLNPDAFPEPGWLAALLAAAAAHPEADAFGSTQIQAEDPTRFDGLGDAYWAPGVPYRAGLGRRVRDRAVQDGEPFSVCAAAALWRRAAFERLGGFDERFFCYAEDVDLGFRLRLAGGRCRQVAAARVAHVGGAGVGPGVAFSAYYGARNRVWVFLKNMPWPLLALLAPAHLAANVVGVAAALRRPRIAGETLRGLWDGFAGAGPILASRRRVQAARRVGLLALAGCFRWAPWAVIAKR